MRLIKPIIIIFLSGLLVTGIVKFIYLDATLINEKEQKIRVGLMVEEVQLAIITPESKQSLKTIQQYGTDSRYYLMIRGWLVQVASGVKSQLNAERDKRKKSALQARYNALQKAIRSIDLE